MIVTRESLSYIVGEVLELPRVRRQGKAYRIVQTIITSLANALQKEKVIRIKGFGIFEIRERAPTRQTCYYFHGLKCRGLHWEVINLPAKKYIIFKPSKVLLQMINQGEK